MNLDCHKPQFLRHPIDDCVLRTSWNDVNQQFNVYVRFSGDYEYQISHTTRMVRNALQQQQPISEEEYYTF